MKQIIATAIALCLFAAAPVYGQHMEITGPEPIPDEVIKLMIANKIYAAVQPSTARRLKIAVEDATDADAVRWGCAAAAHMVEHEGVIPGLPTRAQLDERLAVTREAV